MKHAEFIKELRKDWRYRFWEVIYAPWFFIGDILLRWRTFYREKLSDCTRLGDKEYMMSEQRQRTVDLFDSFGITVNCEGLPEYTKKAKRYMRAPWWWRWTMRMAKMEFEYCSTQRQLELLSRTLDAGNAILEQDAAQKGK